MDSDFGRAEFLDLSLTEADPIPMSHDRHGSNQWATPSGSPSGIPLRAIPRAPPQAPPSGSPSGPLQDPSRPLSDPGTMSHDR